MTRSLYKIGKCGICGFAGILCAPRSFYSADEMKQESITGNISPTFRTVSPCVGCVNTPAGTMSDNQRHKRLPEVEYQK